MPIAVSSTLPSAEYPRSIAGESSSDEALMLRIAAGDKLAIRTLFARHQVRVYRFALRILRDEAIAEDVVSEVFLHVWRRAAQFESRSAVSTWLIAIARNIAISALRCRREGEVNSEMASDIADPADDPESSTAKKEMGSFIQKCLMSLSHAHREVIDLVYYHEMTIDEVAAIIRIPTGTVKTRMFYARSRLRQLLKEGGVNGAS